MGPQMNRLRDFAHFMLRSATDYGSTSAETKNKTYILLRMVLLNINYFSFTAFNKQDVACYMVLKKVFKMQSLHLYATLYSSPL
jgi:hypothetical protein